MFGYTPEEMTGLHLRAVVLPELQDEVVRNYHRRVNGEVSSIRFITKGLNQQGEVVTLEVHGSRLLYRGRPAVVGVGINISDRVRQEEELHTSRERLRELAAYINTLREEQRARIARELHDVVGGMLTSLKLGIQRLERRLDEPELNAILADLRQLSQETIATVREISEDLRPGVLDHFGLVEALKAALGQFAARTGIECRLSPDKLELQLSQARATGVYRICQEALTNIARHAQASSVRINLALHGRELQLEVQDNGRGIRVNTPTGKSIGLISMAERARELGGHFRIDSSDGGGTRLQLTLPIDDGAAA
jgi:PAS domain S-box-containing protein